MILDLGIVLITVLLGLLIGLLVFWSCRRGGSKAEESSKSASSPTQQNENFIRCNGALQTLLSRVLPALQRAIDEWHITTAQNISPCTCTQPNQCPPYKKPSSKHSSCQGCIDLANAIEAAMYPQSAKGSLQWRNAKPALFRQDPLEVMKLFVLRIPDPIHQTYSTLGDFDAASVLMIMARFAPFHGSDRALYELVMKVSNIRNSLSHLKLDNNLHLDDLTFEAHWTNITDLVKLIAGLGKAYFTQQTAQGICSKLTKIKNQPIGPHIEEEALRPLVEDIVLKTMTDEHEQGDHLDVSSCQKRLKAVYRTKKRGIGFLPGFPKEFSSDEFFVDLELVKRQKTPTKVQDIQLKTYTDLLHIQDERGQRLNHVLVSGTAGTGKTTLVSRLAYQWATAETESDSDDDPLAMLTSFQLVFVLDIRRFQPNMDLVDAIKDQLLRHVSKYQLQEYLVVNADKCLFLFDGYDELSLEEVVLNSEHLYSSYVIVTTRPNKVDVICDKYQGYVQVNVTGFSEESISKFVRKFFSVDSYCKSRELLDCLESSMFCQILIQYPLLLAMICVIYKDQNLVPDSISSLFSSVIEYLVRHWKVRTPNLNPTQSLEDFKTEVDFDKFMVLLGKTSLDGLMDKDSKLIFREDDFESIDIIQNGYELGLLSNVSRVHGFEIVSDVFFIHKTFQEYCAAMYLSSLVESDKVLFKDTVSKMDLSDMEYVLRFCCGLSLDAAEYILAHIANTKSHPYEYFNTLLKNIHVCRNDDDFDLRRKLMTSSHPQRMSIFLLYEAEIRYGFCSKLHRILKPLLLCFITDTPMDKMNEIQKVLRYFTNSNHCAQNGWLSYVQLVGLATPGYRDDQDCFQQMLSMMSNLSVLFIYKDMYSAGQNVRFIYMIPSSAPHLKAFHIRSIEDVFDEDDSDELSKVLHWANSLSEFSIGSIQINSCAVSSVVAHLKMPVYCTLKWIGFRNTSLSELDVGIMCEEMIKSCEKADINQLPLIELSLKMNQIGGACSKLAEAMKYLTFLEELYLSETQLTELHCQTLFPALSHLCNLKELDLSHNAVGGSSSCVESACSKLANAFTFMNFLATLCLRNTQLNEVHFQVLGPAFSHLSNLGLLDLSENTIGNSMLAILQGINQCKITWLNLNQTALRGESRNALSHMQLPDLEELWFMDSDMRSEGAVSFAAALEDMPRISTLALSGNHMGSEGAIAIGTKLCGKQFLEDIDLSENYICADGRRVLYDLNIQADI